MNDQTETLEKPESEADDDYALKNQVVNAAIDSARELRVPLLTSSLTTAAAFLPILSPGKKTQIIDELRMHSAHQNILLKGPPSMLPLISPIIMMDPRKCLFSTLSQTKSSFVVKVA